MDFNQSTVVYVPWCWVSAACYSDVIKHLFLFHNLIDRPILSSKKTALLVQILSWTCSFCTNIFLLSTVIKREEAKVQRSLKEAAKKGDKDVCRILAKEIVNSRKAVKKLYAAKATMNSVSMQMKNQASKLNGLKIDCTQAQIEKSWNFKVGHRCIMYLRQNMTLVGN